MKVLVQGAHEAVNVPPCGRLQPCMRQLALRSVGDFYAGHWDERIPVGRGGESNLRPPDLYMVDLGHVSTVVLMPKAYVAVASTTAQPRICVYKNETSSCVLYDESHSDTDHVRTLDRGEVGFC